MAVRRVVDATGRRWSVVAALVFGVVGLVAATLIAVTPVFVLVEFSGLRRRWEFPVIVAFGSALLGGICWWLLVERPTAPARKRGALVGVLAGVLIHPVTWVVVIVLVNLRFGNHPLEGMALTLTFLTFFGLALFGTLTVMIGAGAGIAVAALRGRFDPVDEPDEEFVLASVTSLVLGLVTVTAVLLFTTFLPGLLVGTLLGIAVTALALHWLPVVRQFLLWAYRLADRSPPPGVTDRTFLRRHGVALLTGLFPFFLGWYGYYHLLSVVGEALVPAAAEAPTGSLAASFDQYAFYAYPIVSVVLLVPVALVASRRATGWTPSRSPGRAAAEWTVFVVLLAAVYTGSAVLSLQLVGVVLG